MLQTPSISGQKVISLRPAHSLHHRKEKFNQKLFRRSFAFTMGWRLGKSPNRPSQLRMLIARALMSSSRVRTPQFNCLEPMLQTGLKVNHPDYDNASVTNLSNPQYEVQL